MGFFAAGGRGGDLHGIISGLVLCDWTPGLGKDRTGVLESWGSAGEGVWAVLVASWASVLGVLLGSRFILTARGESCCRGRRRTGASWPRTFFGTSSDLAKQRNGECHGQFNDVTVSSEATGKKRKHVSTWWRLVQLLTAQLSHGGLQLLDDHVVGQEERNGQPLLEKLSQVLQLKLLEVLCLDAAQTQNINAIFNVSSSTTGQTPSGDGNGYSARIQPMRCGLGQRKRPIKVSFPLLSTATQPLALCKQSS